MGSVWDTLRCLFNTPVKVLNRELEAMQVCIKGDVWAGTIHLRVLPGKVMNWIKHRGSK